MTPAPAFAVTMNFACAGNGLIGRRQLALPPMEACAPPCELLPMLGARPGIGVTYCISRPTEVTPAPCALRHERVALAWLEAERAFEGLTRLEITGDDRAVLRHARRFRVREETERTDGERREVRIERLRAAARSAATTRCGRGETGDAGEATGLRGAAGRRLPTRLRLSGLLLREATGLRLSGLLLLRKLPRLTRLSGLTGLIATGVRLRLLRGRRILAARGDADANEEDDSKR